MSVIPTNYYRKELYSNPLFISHGRRAPFEPTGNDEGILATNDSEVIYDLENAVASQVGGVSRITQQEYEELKKKELTTKRSSGRSERVIADQPLEMSGMAPHRYSGLSPQHTQEPVAEERKSTEPAPAPPAAPPPPPPAAPKVRKGKIPTPPPAP